MKKNQLIELLQQLPGNPEIKLWNGLVGDWMDIGQLVESELVKHSVDYFRKGIRHDLLRDGVPADQINEQELESDANECARKSAWEFPNQFLQEERYADWYGKNRKKIYLIEAKKRGQTTYDRLGSIDY